MKSCPQIPAPSFRILANSHFSHFPGFRKVLRSTFFSLALGLGLSLIWSVSFAWNPVLGAEEANGNAAAEGNAAAAEGFRAEPVRLSESSVLIAPHDDSVVVVSRLWLIMKGEIPEEVTLNGQPIRWDRHFGGDVHVGILRLEIGMQNLKIGEKELHFALGRNEKDHAGPADWQVYRLHNMKPGPNPCMWCHVSEKMEEGTFRIGELKQPAEACFKCHLTEKIDVQHSNTKVDPNWREHCRDCHFIHASPHKYLLRQPRETYLKDPTIEDAPEK